MTGNVLSGKTVLEIGTMLAAPFGAHILAQLGADVIKIEAPAGDPTRKLVRGGPSGTYIAYSRGKRSLCLDLASPEGQEVFRRLVRDADIVLHNLAPGAARRLGVTFEACDAANPKVVYCHIRGYGAGPQSEELASNPIAEAATGAMHGHRIDGRPSRLGPSYHDQFAGCYAVIGILNALLADTPTPADRKIEVGLYETGLHVAARDFAGVQLKFQLTGKAEQEPSGEFSMPGYGAYETSDGRWIYLVMLTDRHWSDFWRAIGTAISPDLATLRQRKKQRPQVEALVKAAMMQLSYEEAAGRFAAAGVGFTEVLPLERVLDAPQARAPGKVSSVAFQGLSFDLPDLPFATVAAAERPPALLGEHSDEILRTLGYAEDARETLVRRGTIVVPDPDKPVWAPASREP